MSQWEPINKDGELRRRDVLWRINDDLTLSLCNVATLGKIVTMDLYDAERFLSTLKTEIEDMKNKGAKNV
jgi:energy-converting hydrogenase Eha subunit H